MIRIRSGWEGFSTVPMRTDAAKVIGSMMQLALEQTPKNFELTGKQVYPILYTKKIFVRTGYVMNILE